jgi:hypothetical protein
VAANHLLNFQYDTRSTRVRPPLTEVQCIRRSTCRPAQHCCCHIPVGVGVGWSMAASGGARSSQPSCSSPFRQARQTATCTPAWVLCLGQQAQHPSASQPLAATAS